MTTQTRRITYEEYLELPETKKRYDIVDGVMIEMAPSPTTQHQVIAAQLFAALHQFVAENRLGRALFAPLDVLVQLEPLRTRQPDLLFVSKERTGILGQIVEGAPDLVVEILSPSNSRSDVQQKLADYASIGVTECWLVSPEAQTVEVLELSEGNLRRIYLFGLGDTVQSNVLEGIEVEVEKIFEQQV